MTIDLTKRKVSPAAKPATGLAGKPPIPVGKSMKVNRLLPDEEKELRKHGWKPGDPIPSNFAELIAAVKPSNTEDLVVQKVEQELLTRLQQEATDPDFMDPPGPLNTPPLSTPTEIDINELSPERQTLLTSVLRQAREMDHLEQEIPQSSDQSLRNAIMLAQIENGPAVEDDTKAEKYSTGFDKETKVEPSFELVTSNETDTCARCGWPKDLSDPIEVTELDKTSFLQCLLGLRPFEKSYDLYGGRLHIRVRSLTPAESDSIWLQINTDTTLGRLKSPTDQRSMIDRYRAVLQVIAIEGLAQDIKLPTSTAAWEKSTAVKIPEGETIVRGIYNAVQHAVTTSETMNRMLVGAVQEFNFLCLKLEASSRDPGFWKAIEGF